MLKYCDTKWVSIIVQRRSERHQFGINSKHPDTRRITKSIRHVLSAGISKRYARYQIGITIPGPTGTRGGTSHKRGAQGNADIRSHSDTRIGDASGVKPEAPKGVRWSSS